MNSGNWIELAALVVTILGGGGITVSRLTRIAVGLEAFGKALETLGQVIGDTSSAVASHDTRIAVHDHQLDAHEARLAVLEKPGP